MPRRPRSARKLMPALLVAAAGVSSVSLIGTAIGDCPDWMGTLQLDAPTDISISETTWLGSATNWRNVYRVDATGPNGSKLEVWAVAYDSIGECELIDLQTDPITLEDGHGSIEWTSSFADGLNIVPAAPGVAGSYQLLLSKLASPPQGEVWVIPAVAHAPGVGGSFFRSALTVFNPTIARMPLDVSLLRRGEVPLTTHLVLEPGGLVASHDVVFDLFGLDNAVGALSIQSPYSSRSLVLSSHTYTLRSGGRFGQSITPQPWHDSAGSEADDRSQRRRVITHLSSSADFRSNLGLVEVIGVRATAWLRMYDLEGRLIGEDRVRLEPFEHRQINDIFGALHVPPSENAYLEMLLEGNGRLFCYASVIDNRTQDPVLVPGLAATDAGVSHIIPAAASGPGQLDTWWQTDLYIVNLDGNAPQVHVRFNASGNGTDRASVFRSTSGPAMVLEDVVGQLGAEGSGALVLESINGSIVANSRTYTSSERGTRGQFIGGYSRSWSIQSSTIVGIESSADSRTNVGFFNPSFGADVDVVVSLVAADGRLLARRSYPLPGEGHLQINDIFTRFLAAREANCRVDVETLAEHYYNGVLAYASVVDNHTGDAIYLPATAQGRPLSTRFELDNRDNAILIDQLPPAVGTDRLPDGVFSASLTGNGDLGAPQLPIHVVCLYKDPSLVLRSASLHIGDGLEAIAGNQPIWCVIPDWINASDNHGQVTLELTDGSQSLSFELDARSNAVLLDQQPQTVVIARPPAEAYAIQATGNLGRDELPPQIVVMNRDARDGRLRVRALTNGGQVPFIATDFQVAAVVFDWMSSNDNTGRSTFVQDCTIRQGSCGDVVTGNLSSTDCMANPASIAWTAETTRFAGNAGDTVDLKLDRSNPAYSRLSLLAPDGHTLRSVEMYGETLEIEGVVLLEDGEHTVQVSGSSNYTWDYTLEITCR